MAPADLATRPQQQLLDLPRTDPGAAGAGLASAGQAAGAGLASAGQAADAATGRRVFDDYRDCLAEETQRRHDADLACFASFLAAAGIAQKPNISEEPAS